MRLEERPGEAVTEYDKARLIREKLCQPHDRELCDVYFCLAGAFIDLSAKVEGSEAVEKKQEALVNYRRARDVLLVRKSLVSGADLQEIEDLVDILTESIDALQVEMNISTLKSSEGRPTTTIGFGAPNAAGENSSSKKRSAEEVSSSEVQVLQVRSLHAAFIFSAFYRICCLPDEEEAERRIRNQPPDKEMFGYMGTIRLSSRHRSNSRTSSLRLNTTMKIDIQCLAFGALPCNGCIFLGKRIIEYFCFCMSCR